MVSRWRWNVARFGLGLFPSPGNISPTTPTQATLAARVLSGAYAGRYVTNALYLNTYPVFIKLPDTEVPEYVHSAHAKEGADHFPYGFEVGEDTHTLTPAELEWPENGLFPAE